MRLGATDPQAVALLFSLSTNLMPLLLTGLSFLVLPEQRRSCALLPIFIFLASSMSAAFASVADGPCAAAYASLLFLLLATAPLSKTRLGLILLLALGCLRLHEAMVFLGPFLVTACLLRMRATEGYRSVILGLAALLIAAGSIQAGFDILHPRMPGNRASFVQDVAGLRWLWTSGGINMPALAGLAAILILPAGFLPARQRFQTGLPAAILFTALAITAAILPAAPASAFAARGNACLIAAGAFGLFLAGQRFAWRGQGFAPFAAFITALLTVTVTAGNLRADLDWMRYRTALQSELSRADGLIAFPLAREQQPMAQNLALQRGSWPWTSPLMSLWLAPGGRVRSLLLNPPGVSWQPFDPAELAPQLPLPASAALASAFRP